MVFVALAGIPLGWVGWKVDRARNQRLVVAELQKLHALFQYDYQIITKNGVQSYRNLAQPPGPEWLTAFLGKEYFVDLYSVTVGGLQVNDETLALIARLPEVEILKFTPVTGITDTGLVHLAGMHKLEVIALSSDHITGAGLVHLAKLNRLKWLDVSGWATDASLEHISTLKHLEVLHVFKESQITDRGLANVAKLTNLQSLHFGSDGKYSAILQDYMKITDEGLIHLYGLKNLESLSLNTMHVTQAGIDNLQKALPNCKIEWNPTGSIDIDAIDGVLDQ